MVPEEDVDKDEDGDAAMWEGSTAPSHDAPSESRDVSVDEDVEADRPQSDASSPTSTTSSVSIASVARRCQSRRPTAQLMQSPAVQKPLSRTASSGHSHQSFEQCAPLFKLLRRTEWVRSQSIRPDVVNLYSNFSHRKSLLQLLQVTRNTLEETIGHDYPHFNLTLKSTFDYLYHLSRVYNSKDSLIRHHCKGILDFISPEREGLRWQELIDIFESEEILLIGSDEESEDKFLDREWLSIDFMDNPATVEMQFRTYRGYAGFPFGAVVRSGIDEVFEKLKKLLLDSELKLKELCVALDGIFEKMRLLSEVDKRYGDKSSVRHGADTEKEAGRDLRQDADTAKTLTRELEDQIEALLGSPRQQAVRKPQPI